MPLRIARAHARSDGLAGGSMVQTHTNPLRQRIWAWLLPPERFPRSDGLAYQSAAAIVLLAAGGSFILLAFVVVQFLFDVRMLALPAVVAACGMLGLLIEFRRKGRPRLYGNAICLLLFGGVIVTEFLSGGQVTSPLIALPIMVFLTALALDRRDALIWAILAMVTAFGS
ncbi:MAG TPA: hypothetical protein VK660_06050, partial [Xanthomonadaceae bacterium]|nr:hypothetical protein [Xanthomonadaceae bacterium]